VTTRSLPRDEAAREAASFVPVQVNGQWRVQNVFTGLFHGQAFRYEREAAHRAQHLERIYR
jgi:hypothetical protein